MNDFYVYGLIDPRTNSLFYIGKGRGNRINQHFHNKVKSDGNNEKIRVINEIQNTKLNVKKIQIGKNLSEESAYILEKILIYRIGRVIFDEGTLTNIQPGGLWKQGDKYILEKEDILNDDIIRIKHPELIPILEFFPHISLKFTSFKSSDNSEINNIYVYNNISHPNNQPHIFDINEFLNYFDIETSIKIINVLKSNTLPLFFMDNIYSKSEIKKRPDFSNIPFEDFDLFDFNFVKKLNKSIEKQEDVKIECFYSNGNILADAELFNNKFSFTYYYENGKIKHRTIELDYYKEFKSWYENGVLEIEKNYNNYGARLSYKCWYENENLKEEEYKDERNSLINKKSWYENGVLESEWIYKKDREFETKKKSWYENGVLESEIIYENQVIKNFKSWNNKGELLSDTDESGFNKVIKPLKKDDQYRLEL
jgi:antitoxin component YwqK of YwqJK toxin-antitoxin module